MEHKKEEKKVTEVETKKTCNKNMTCLGGHCTCLKKLAKALAFIMLVIITISVVKIACSVTKMEKHGKVGMQQSGMHYLYR